MGFNLKRIIIFFTIVLFSVVCIGAQQVVKAELSKTEYQVGDLIEVSIEVENNTSGFHGMFFDLSYDSSVLEFDGIVNGSEITNESIDHEMLYAYSNEGEAHVIVSYTLQGNDQLATESGQYIKARFSVVNSGISSAVYNFDFSNYGLLDGTGSEITATWQNSENFQITSPYSETFILIKEPYEYQVFYENSIECNLICSTGDFKVLLSNEDNTDFTAIETQVSNGILLDQTVDIVSGFNRITAKLYDNNDNLLCEDVVKVYRSGTDKFINIESPLDHSLVNTDMVEVEVHSPFDNVKINGIIAEYYGETISDTHAYVYKTKIWLTQGFNKITALATSSDGVTYKDEIEVYYQKDSSIFNFVLPSQNEYLKPSSGAKLYIKGEIDSLYKTDDDPSAGEVVENTVTLKVIYKPSSKIADTITLVNNEPAIIEEAVNSYEFQTSKFIFYNDFDIPIDTLDSGEIEIIAYKNKEGSTWDNEIHRIVYIDNNRLWIDLVQPNVYTSDELDTLQKVIDANESNSFTGDGNIELSSEGAFVLKSTDRVVTDEGLTNVISLIEKENGTLYALVNDLSNEKMKIYKKSLGDSEWELEVSKTGVYGYSLCDVDIGILVGVSNLYTSGTSGLFLLREGQLLNLDFQDENISYVQFIENHNGKIYFYGNYYDYLYSFNIYSLEEDNGILNVPSVSKIEFHNSVDINDFILTDEGYTAVIKTSTNNIYFYKKNDDVFSQVNMPELDDDEGSVTGEYMILGEYDTGDYNTYAIIKNNTQAEIIMENKKTGNFTRINADLENEALLDEAENNITLMGIGFKDNNFVFLYNKDSDYYIKRGQLFFNIFYEGSDTESYESQEIILNNYNLFILNDGSVFAGIGLASDNLYDFYNKYEDTGTAEFNYWNNQIDGLTGLGFEVDPIWLTEENAIIFGFDLKEIDGESSSAGDTVIFSLTPSDLYELFGDDITTIEVEGEYTITSTYDDGEGRYIIHFEFDELMEDKYLSFYINLNSVGNASPSLYNLSVYKKVKAKICKEPGDTAVLPIHGYVYDNTVEEVVIQDVYKVQVERDCSFYHDLEINTTQSEVEIEMYCINGASEKAELDFTVEIIDSINDVFDVTYQAAEDSGYTSLVCTSGEDFEITTMGDTISIEGKYFGLSGCVVGYEIYKEDDTDSGTYNLKKRDVFDLELDDSVYDFTDLGSGYECGYFRKTDIELLPGNQKFVIYCENPGGSRVEYMSNGKYPFFTYKMPVSDQQIIFYIEELSEEETIDDLPVSYFVNLPAYETEEEPYVFTREYEISGWVKTVFDVDELNIKSLTDGLSFDDGTGEVIIETEDGNMFKININIEMGDDEFVKDYYVSVIPTNPSFSYLKKGFKVIAKKSYKDTNYIPDFSPIDPDNWTTEEKKSTTVPIKFLFNRNDVPDRDSTGNKGYIEANLLVNYEYNIIGEVYYEDGYYYLDTDSSADTRTKAVLQNIMIKEGINRIQWSLIFRDFVDNAVDGEPYLMSYSDADTDGMDDYIFEYINDTMVESTIITFNPDLTDEYYDETTLVEVNITKDQRTLGNIYLNDKLVYSLDSDETSVTLGYTDMMEYIEEGKNELIIKYTEPGTETEIEKAYVFMFDSAEPVVWIESYKTNEDFTKLISLTANVTEANFSEGFLYYGNDIVNDIPEIIIKSSNKYQLVWNDLSDDNITPTSLKPVKVRIDDLAGKNSYSSLFLGFDQELDRPEDTEIQEINIDIPKYDNSPVLANETNYESRFFESHTKFAPEKFIKRVSIKSDVQNNGNYLIKSGKPEKAEPIYWSKCESVDNLTNADIYDTDNPPELPSTSGFSATPGVYNNGVRCRLGSDGIRYFYPFGSDFSPPDKMTISFDINQECATSDEPYLWFILDDSISTYIRFGSDSGSWTHRIVVGGETESTSSANLYHWHHVYIVIDKNANLEGDKSIRVFVNNVEIMSSSNELTLNSFEMRFESGYEKTSDTLIDNLKIWDYIVTQDSDVINNVGDIEDFKTSEDYYTPAYWSKCESVENITTSPEIGDSTGVAAGVEIKNDDPVFGNYINASSDDSHNGNGTPYATWQPQGESFILSKEGTISYWFQSLASNASCEHSIHLGNFAFRFSNGSTLELDVNGTSVNDIYDFVGNGWHQVYIVWDEQGKLPGYKTIIVYIGDTIVLQSDAALANWDYIDDFMYSWYDGNSGGDSIYSIDNVKYWDHVVSDTPDWLNDIEGNEDNLAADTEADPPVYWSRCETWDNVVNPEIAEYTPEVVVTGSPVQSVVEGIFENGLSVNSSCDDHRVEIYPARNIDCNKLVISCCILPASGYSNFVFSIGGYRLRFSDFNATSGTSRIYDHESTTVLQSDTVNINRTDWTNVYIIIDTEAENQIKAYINNTLEVISDSSIELGDLSNSDLYIQLSSHNSTDGAANYIDNIKIWDYVVSEDPEYIASKEETSSLPENYGKYLVFKIAKDPFVNNIIVKDDIIDNIQFKVIGKKINDEENVVEVTDDENYPLTSASISNPLTFDGTGEGEGFAYQYVEGKNYLYYMVDADLVKAKYQEVKNHLTRVADETYEAGPLYTNGEDVIVDPGSLKIIYSSQWTNFKPADIYLVGLKDEDDEVYHAFKDIITYDAGYESVSAVGDYTALHPDIRYPLYETDLSESDRTFIKDESSDAFTVSFWTRIEDDCITDDGTVETVYANRTKRILTAEYESNEIISLRYKGTSLFFYDHEGLPVDLGTSLDIGDDVWNMITMVIDKDNNDIKIYKNDTVIAEITDLPETVIETLLKDDVMYFYGADDSVDEEYNSGFFSVAIPFYINRGYTGDEILRTYNLADRNAGSEINISFTGINEIFNIGDCALHQIGGNDFFTADENCNYEEANTNGAFKASSAQEDLLTIKDTATIQGIVLFTDAENCVVNNLSVTVDEDLNEDSFTLKLDDTSKKGKYYFGDKNGNYSLGTDKYYSVSGKVLSMAQDIEAKIVLRINNEEQSLDLAEGTFHFIYENSNNTTPSDVKLYIETTGKIILSTNMSLNKGNYIIENTLEQTAASTSFPYDLNGTISFWYKPLNSNKDGYVNYEAILFNGEYIKIGTELVDGDAVYYAQIMDEDGTVAVDIETNTKVKHNWQFLQLSYSNDYGVVYFYINGDIAGMTENVTLPVFGNLQGFLSSNDNVFIGCNHEKTVFAEGYFDNLVISKYYMENKYADYTPSELTFEYPDIDMEYIIENIDDLITDDSLTYRIDAVDSDFYAEGTAFPVDAALLDAGRYRLTAYMKYNEHNFKDIITFNIDEKPKVDLVEHTPIVFTSDAADIKSDISFKFRYDNSYKFKNEALIYPGAAVKIIYNTDESELKYLVQDYINQDTSKWQVGTYNADSGLVEWEELTGNNDGTYDITFEELDCTDDVNYEIKNFYFENTFDTTFDDITGIDSEGTIPLAGIYPSIEEYAVEEDGNTVMYEYKLTISALDETDDVTSAASEMFEDIEIGYKIFVEDDTTVKTGSVNLDNTGLTDLFYDDILPDYGTYHCDLMLSYDGVEYAEVTNIELIWEKRKGMSNEITVPSKLEIDEFSVLYLDAENDKINLFLKYDAEETGGIDVNIDIFQDGQLLDDYGYSGTGELGDSLTYDTKQYNNLDIPKGASTIKITLRSQSALIMDTQEIDINNYVGAPEIVLTNWVESQIPYNNVLFSWKGYYDDKFNENIEYTYNFDDSGWSTPNTAWRNVRFYNLEEGYHSFQVKAVYKDVESSIRSVTFFVDVERPVFDSSKIEIEKLYDEYGIFYAVNITGDSDAIVDSSLREVYANDEEIVFLEDGTFAAYEIPITKDGINTILLTAVDKVGNITDYNVYVENYITNIIFPQTTTNVKYCPLVIVGEIADDINAEIDIYVRDPFCEDKEEGDYSGWKKAKINEDRTFFVEDIYINPGSKAMEILTTLEIKTVFESGREFDRDFEVYANEIIMPIELTLSTHAAEGENADTIVGMTCKANVDNISSWSIDYNGDGVYDEIDLTDNPYSDEARSHSWTHKYSSLGMVEPRVRVITTNGNYFSITDTLIIHEKIKEASNKIVENPISISALKMADSSDMIFVLKETEPDHFVEVYEVGRNETYISNKLYTINITSLGIDNPVVVRALTKDHLFIGENNSSNGVLYEIAANEYGNYEIKRTAALLSYIKDITLDDYCLYVSLKNSANFIKIPIEDNMIDINSMEEFIPTVNNSISLGANTGLAKDEMGLLVADYYNQRIVRLSNTLNVNEQFGSIGQGEGEFLKPSIIKSHENRIFIFDEARKDIQVFDLNYVPVCTLKYDADPDYYNYLEAEFFNDIADIDIITKVENNLLYYYALILSKSTGKLAMLRLPQWEELRARVRNNKIVFIQDGEIFTAKPDGSDLMKILSSDSIPRIEGTLDYPALSPDGRTLVFTSQASLYIGEEQEGGGTNEYAYDNIYVVDIETQEINKINLGVINGYEIERPVFNSNGDKLIFGAKETGYNWQIYVYNFEDAGISQLFESEENARFPYYSPDDRFVVFTTDYDGDEEIEIIDTDNTTIRVTVTNNYARDSYPVWSTVYPYEILNDELDIESKIAFVSERDYHKGIYYTYIKRPSDSDIRVVKYTGEDISNDPDSAAIEITNDEVEGDYPCFTGDGTALIFEYFNGEYEILKKCDFNENYETNSADKDDRLNGELDFALEDMELPGSAVSPAGMKNMITNFTAENKNGDEIELAWDRYTDNDIFYLVRFQIDAADEEYVEKKVFSQTGTVLKGLEMGQKYLVKVCIVENEEEVATSQWKKVEMPYVVARPSYTIDEDNPYLVHFEAWKPDEDKQWMFYWKIDNTEYNAGDADTYSYEFATSGEKTIQLKATDSSNKNTDYSSTFEIDIISDIIPVIEYALAEDSSYIELSCENSEGKKIDFANTEWTITGTGNQQSIVRTGSLTNVDLTGFLHKIYVNLKLRRKVVDGQTTTDIIEKNMVIDLDFKEVRPIIESHADESNSRLIRFSGEQSIGNITWTGAAWTIFANNGVLYTASSVSTFEYLFPETNEDTVYTVSLTVPRRNDGMTETVSQVVCVDATPIEPVINYEILTLEEDGNTVGAKILFDCSKSIGSNIDYYNATWSLPIANSYGEQAQQTGSTALYNLVGAGEDMIAEVSLTLSRSGGTDPITVTEIVNIAADEVSDSKLVVNNTLEESSDGTTLILDVLSSTGPNIDWQNTTWQVDGQSYSQNGPTIRIDVPATGEDRIINYVCSLYRYSGDVQTVTGKVEVDKTEIEPIISYRRLSASQNNVYELSVLDTNGVNIDWTRTRWFIYDGNENVTEKSGSSISHAFALVSEQMGYPVMVEMYLKGGTTPFIGYTTIDVEGDELLPIITYDTESDDPNVITFSATTSKGSGIDWSNAKWTFGDSSEYQYGASATHEYAVSSENKKYRVTLTLGRSNINGNSEVEVAYKDITIGQDKIVPKVTAVVKSGTLFLSAEDSEGRGLLLDRSTWLFAGEGDSFTSSDYGKSGVVKRYLVENNINSSISTGVDYTQTGNGFFFHANGGFGVTFTTDITDYSGYEEHNETFSTSNSHTGVTCRRYIDDESKIPVVLLVYRINSDNTVEGESITVVVDIDEAKSGVTYE